MPRDAVRGEADARQGDRRHEAERRGRHADDGRGREQIRIAEARDGADSFPGGRSGDT